MMAKGANGTIQINTQTIKQREQFGGDDGKFGVAIDRFGADNMFPDSPIASNSGENMYVGEMTNAGAALGTGAANIYSFYANVIDPADNTPVTTGFGFSGGARSGNAHAQSAYMNYRHPENPFIDDDNTNYLSLTSGEKYEENKAYRGFPDITIPRDNPLGNPTQGEGEAPSSLHAPSDNLENLPNTLDAKGLTWGSSTHSYREKLSQDNMLGKHINGSFQGNGNIEQLGMYFRNNYNE